MTLQGERRFIRIDNKGFFFSPYLSTSVKWSEIFSLAPYTRVTLGHRVATLGVIPQEPEAITARFIADSGNFYLRFFTKINLYFYRHSTFLTPLNIPQTILPAPVSIDELIAMIRERFAGEMNEYHVAVSEWQAVDDKFPWLSRLFLILERELHHGEE